MCVHLALTRSGFVLGRQSAQVQKFTAIVSTTCITRRIAYLTVCTEEAMLMASQRRSRLRVSMANVWLTMMTRMVRVHRGQEACLEKKIEGKRTSSAQSK